MQAIEYVLKAKFAKQPELAKVLEFTHFACTSEDINNLAYSLMLKEAVTSELLPALDKVSTHSLGQCCRVFFGGGGLGEICRQAGGNLLVELISSAVESSV